MSNTKEPNQFTVLENKTIGRNISLYRNVRGLKAQQVAESLGLKEQSYTRYERGEAAITIEMIQKLAEIFNVDPLMLLSVSPGAYIDSGNNSPGAILGMVHGNYNFQTTNEQQTQIMLKLMENVATISEHLIRLLDKKK